MCHESCLVLRCGYAVDFVCGEEMRESSGICNKEVAHVSVTCDAARAERGGAAAGTGAAEERASATVKRGGLNAHPQKKEWSQWDMAKVAR